VGDYGGGREFEEQDEGRFMQQTRDPMSGGYRDYDAPNRGGDYCGQRSG